MSRTYHHGDKAKERLFGFRWFNAPMNEWHHPLRGSLAKKKRNHLEWQWMSTPSWWVREMMTRPQRARTRQLLHKVMRLRDVEDAPPFPLAKRPHVYYW